jgi:hypothetical protein
VGSNREQRERLESVHVFLALLRTGTNQDHRCMRQVIRNYYEDLKFLEMRCLARGGEWRIHQTVNARDPEKAMRYLMKKLIDHPELCTDVDLEWRSALLQPECIYGEKLFMLDVDTQDEDKVKAVENIIYSLYMQKLTQSLEPEKIERILLHKIKSPKGWHYITKPFDTREVLELEYVTLQRDGYYYVKTVGYIPLTEREIK